MQKTTTPERLTVFLFKNFLFLLLSVIIFEKSYSQKVQPILNGGLNTPKAFVTKKAFRQSLINQHIIREGFQASPATLSGNKPPVTTGEISLPKAAVAVCNPPTSSILSQAGGVAVANNLINEGFATINTTLPPTGWAIKNLSTPVGTTPNWDLGNQSLFNSNSGAADSYIAAGFSNIDGTGIISNWLFTPNVTLKNGDQFSFYTKSHGDYPDRLQVRLSTSGVSTNVGASNISTGDFSALLLDINPTYVLSGYPTNWKKYSITISGMPAAGISGRLAFRYFVEDGGPTGNNSDYIGIDDVLYTTYAFAPVSTCVGSTANLKVDIAGGDGAAYDVTIHPSTGADFTVKNYITGSNIPVTPVTTTTYNLSSVVQSDNLACSGTGNSGTPTITVSNANTQPIAITANPATTICSGGATTLTVAGSTAVNASSVTVSGILNTAIPDSPDPNGASSVINVLGIPSNATITSVGVKFNITHTADDDLSIFLKSPNNKVLNLVDRKGAESFGSGENFVNTNITSDAVTPLPTADGSAPFTGTFKPDASLAIPAPSGYAPNATSFTPLFAGNGNWGFAVLDNSTPDVGKIVDWTLTINYTVPAGPLPSGYTYSWTPVAGLNITNSFQVTATPAATTTYSVLVTAPGGCQSTAAYTVTVNQAPAITADPVNTSVCSGTVANFTAAATGTGAVLQWQVSSDAGTNWTNISDGATYTGTATGALKIIATTPAMDGFKYRMLVTGTCTPEVVSNGATLSVTASPVITGNPVNTTVCEGTSTSFTANGTGAGAAIQWQVSTDGGATWTNVTNAAPYTGATTGTLSINPAAVSLNNNRYRLTVSGTCTPAVNSTAAVLTINANAVITTNPSNTTICAGSTASFTAVTNATSLQWQESTDGGTSWNNITNGTPYSGVNTATLSINAVTASMSSNKYRLTGTGTCTSIATSAATLTVNALPVITSNPASITVCETAPASFTANGTGTGTSLQWQVSTDGGTNWTNLTNAAPYSGVTSGILTVNSAATSMNNNRYRLTISGTCTPAANSGSAVLTVTAAPTITTNPSNTSICSGANTSFTAATTGSTLQWQLSTDGGTSWVNITNVAPYTGATTGTLNITAAAAAMNGNRYRLTASGTCSPAATSAAALLTINPPPVVNTNPSNVTICAGSTASFTASGTGTAMQWQVSTDGGTSWTNISNSAPYSGVTTGTLTISAAGASLNSNSYRMVITSACATVANTAKAVLKVNTAPTVTLSAAPYTKLLPGLTTTLTSVTAPAADIYTWMKNSAIVSGATGSSLLVKAGQAGDYSLKVTDINGCTNTSGVLTITDSISNKLFIYPNPTHGQFYITYNGLNSNAGAPQGINIYDAKGRLVLSKTYGNNSFTSKIEINLNNYNTGIYWVEVVDATGYRLAVSRVEVIR
jgi:subtilisin-like proprotein convertase family protein